MALLASLWVGHAAFAQANPVATPPPAPPPTSAAIPPIPPLAALSSYHGMMVKDIEFRGIESDQRMTAQMRDLVKQEIGKPLERITIRRSMQALYATGRFADLQVEAQRTGPNELTLVFDAQPNFFIGSITSDAGLKRPSDSQLVDSSKLQLGEVLTRAKVEQSIERILAIMRDNGYYRATVTESEAQRQDVQLTDVNFHIVPGPPAKIGQVTVEGDPGFTTQEIVKISNMKAGKQLTQDRVTKGLQNLRKKYSSQKRLESQIAIASRTYRDTTNTVDFTYRIERGPLVDIVSEGASFSKRKLKKLVPVYEENAVDEDLLNEGRRNIRDYLQTQGYFDAKVNYTESSDPDKLHVIYDVDRGDKHDVVRVILEGNKYFDDELIRERLQVQPKSIILSHGRFSQPLMNQDVNSITRLYKSNGFLEASVEAEMADDVEGKTGDMAVTYKIQEGPQTRVAKMTIQGDTTFPTDELAQLMNTQEGQAYSEANIALDRDAILNFYFDKGFPNTQFEYKSAPTPNTSNSMDVTFTIMEGKQFFVDRVLTSDLEFTRPYVVQNQMQIKPGDPLSQTQMAKTQAALYDLGVFNEVKMAVQNPDGDAKYKDVLIQLQEAKRWTFNYGFGVEASTGQPDSQSCSQLAQEGQTSLACSQGRTGVSPRVTFDVSRINFRGKANTLTLKSNVGRLQQRVLIAFEEPRWLDKANWSFTATAFYDNSVNVTTFTSERLEGSVQLEDRYSRVSRFIYRMTYRRVKASNVVVSPDQIPLLSQPVRIAMPSFAYIRDKRDNVIDTQNGNYTTLDAGVAAKALGSQASFTRFIAQNSTYHPFKGKKSNKSMRWVFARNLRLGVEQPFNETVIPLPERFFAGGTNSHRGFALNQAGPRDLTTGSPLGGYALVVNSFELRTPPLLLPWVADNLSFAFFHDAGNVFQDTNQMVNSIFRWHQPHKEYCESESTAQQCSFAYISHAVGAGVRYRTPIGPIRIDIGYNLNPPVYPAMVAGPNNTTVFQSFTTRRINVFFSIGQTF
jgi:outer membrane protein insertion porin family